MAWWKKKVSTGGGKKLSNLFFGIVCFAVIAFALVSNLDKFNFDLPELSDFLIEIDESQTFDDIVVDADFDTARQKLFIAGLSKFEFGFTNALINQNTDTPTSNVVLSHKEFFSLINVLVGAVWEVKLFPKQVKAVANDNGSVSVSIDYLFKDSGISGEEIKVYLNEKANLSVEESVFVLSELEGVVSNLNLAELSKNPNIDISTDIEDEECFLTIVMDFLNGTNERINFVQKLNFSHIDITAESVTLCV